MPRATKLTPEVHRRIVDYLKAGAYLETAAAGAGVSKTTLYDWLRRGARATTGPHHDFAEAVQHATAEDELRGVLQVERIAGGAVRPIACPKCGTAVPVPAAPTNVQLQALLWKLERKYSDRYGGKLKLEHSERVQRSLESALEAARPFMRQESYADVIQALAQAMGLEDLVGSADP
jgi:hypothetical protein